MTLHEALGEVRRVGSIRVENGKLKLRFPEAERFRLEPAIDALRQNRDAALQALASTESGAVPPPACWPESLLNLAQEYGEQTGDIETAREKIWITYTEFLARRLNLILDETGMPGPGRTPAKIKPETIRNGMEKAARRREPSR
jgi:hypothetical protein